MKGYKPKKIAVVIAGHGSKLAGFDAALKKVVRGVRQDKRFFLVQHAYLAINSPSISEAIRRCARKGAKEIRVLPYFLLSGKHIVLHIPQIISTARKNFPGVKIVLCPYLGYDKKLVSLVKERLSDSAGDAEGEFSSAPQTAEGLSRTEESRRRQDPLDRTVKAR